MPTSNLLSLASKINEASFTLAAFSQHIERVKREPVSKIRQEKLSKAIKERDGVSRAIDSLWNQVLSNVSSKFDLIWMEENVYCDFAQRQEISKFKSSEVFLSLPNR